MTGVADPGVTTDGVPAVLSPRVRRLTCPNPGVMTGPGTNTYLVGDDEIAVIDPGPDQPEHLDAIARAVGDRVKWIVVTHTHPDHSPGAEPLRQRLGSHVRVLGFEPREGFDPDSSIGDGHVIDAEGFTLRAIHTPGHAGNHLCYLLEEDRLLFSGDHIMNGSTVVITPPDGNMATYFASLDLVRALDVDAIAPGHGRIIDDPVAKIDEYLAHRRKREEKVAAALAAAGGPVTVADLLPVAYDDVDEARHRIASFSLWAHLQKLVADGRADADDPTDLETAWRSLT